MSNAARFYVGLAASLFGAAAIGFALCIRLAP